MVCCLFPAGVGAAGTWGAGGADPAGAFALGEGFRFVFDPNRRGNLPKDVTVTGVAVAGDFSNWKADRFPLEKLPDGTFARFVELSAGVHHYKFVINGKHWIPDPSADLALSIPDNYGGVNSGVRVEQTRLDPSDAAKINSHPDFHPPDWAKDVVWYQIMVDRFRNGDTENDPAGVGAAGTWGAADSGGRGADPAGTLPWTWDWGRPYTGEEKKGSYGTYWARDFGGDIAGLTKSLDYLEELGITGIYLNPVFKSRGYHKYNVGDYRHIDDHFGVKGDVDKIQKSESLDSGTWILTPTDRMFLTFLKEAHARGFKVILDGVFNHCGEDFWAFQDVIRREKESAFSGWFSVSNWDIPEKWPGGPAFEYAGWHGFGGLPEFAESAEGLSPGVRDHLFDVAARWMDPNADGDPSDGIDGWRLDAADDVNPNFWAAWRSRVKNLNPDALIVGEIWPPAPELLKGDHFDALMNYQFAMRAVNFFVNTIPALSMTPSQFQKSLEDLLSLYPPHANFAMQNLFASHDVDRLASMIRNPNRAYDQKNRLQDNPAYDISRPSDRDYASVKLMVAFQMTFPGAPLIWYGDEAGMYGTDDPANRMPMWWPDLMPYDNPDYIIREDVRAHFKHLIAIRNAYPAIRGGRWAGLLADDQAKIFVYERRDAGHRLIVAMNNDRIPHTVNLNLPDPQGGTYVNVMDRKSVTYLKKKVQGLDADRPQIMVDPDAPKFSPADGVLHIDLLPKSAAIFLEIPR